jgi:L-alanine-DL-glutamate epimerase-like enolase superfamily enzyme
LHDLARIGGVAGRMKAARLADARKVSMTSHLMCEASAQALSAGLG